MTPGSLARHTLAAVAGGAAVAAVIAAGLLVFTPRLAADEPPSGSPFKNVKVLTGVQTKQEMRKIMREQAAALGQKCNFCHVPGKFDLDDKKEKVKARHMMEMVNALNDKYFSESDEKPRVTCWTCHRGNKEPQRLVPADLLSTDSMEPAPGSPPPDAPKP